MKPRRTFFLLCSLAGVSLLSPSAKAQTPAVLESEQFLRSHAPLNGILGLPNKYNTVQGEDAKALFRSQLQAIHGLDHANDPTAIDVLIPFLSYTPYDSVALAPYHEGQIPLVNDVSQMFPAFGAILSNPAAAVELEKYVLNTDHLIEHRFAAIHVLRYVDKKRFQVVVGKFGRELAHAGPRTKDKLEWIRDKDSPFDGIHSTRTDE